MILKAASAVGAFILALDATALMVAVGAAGPDTKSWVEPLALAAFGSAGVVIAIGAAVMAWRTMAEHQAETDR